VVDSHLRTPLLSKLVRGAPTDPLVILHRNGADPARIKALADLGVTLVELPACSAGVDLTAGLRALAALGLTRVLAEGGGGIAAGLLRDNLVDRLSWFHAPLLIGGDGWPATQAFGLETLAVAPKFHAVSRQIWGEDVVTHFRKS